MTPFHRFIASLLLAVLVVFAYEPVRQNGFVNFDDPLYVTKNPVVLEGLASEGVVRAFTEFRVSNWHPLTWVSHMADVSIFGPGPLGPHLVNVALHATNAILLFLWLGSVTGAPVAAFLASALFAVHPIHVESVAWISERKDLLFVLFGLLALTVYSSRVRRGESPVSVAVVAMMAMGLLSKPMLVTLPLVLLLVDVWPLGRLSMPFTSGGPVASLGWADAVREKKPLFILSVLSSLVTVVAQSWGGAVATLEKVPLPLRLANVPVAYVSYLRKAFWPVDLHPIYLLPDSIPVLDVLVSIVLLSLLIGGAWVVRRRRPEVAVGFAWMLVALLPVIGIIQVGRQSMADRYAYFPFIGLYAALIFGIGGVLSELKNAGSARKVLVALGLTVLGILVLQTRLQSGYWKDSETLFRRTVGAYPGNIVAWNNLGNTLAEQGRHSEATEVFDKVLKIDPLHAKAHVYIGGELVRQGRVAEGLVFMEKSVVLDPMISEAWHNLGVARTRSGDPDAGKEAFEKAVKLDDENAAAWNNLAILRMNRGDVQGALAALEYAAAADPRNGETLYNLAVVASKAGDAALSRQAVDRLRKVSPELADRLSTTPSRPD